MSSDYSDNVTGLRPSPPGQDSDSSICVNPTKTVNYSPVPRRPSSKDMYVHSGHKDSHTDDMIAPLGFEPEGSATKPYFCEGNSSLLDFISDRNGYTLFRDYLREHKHESLLDFWQSCEEYKQLANTGSNLATLKANATYNNYLHSKHLCASLLQDNIRAKVKHKLGSGQALNEMLFDQAKDCILGYMNSFHYGRFLGSDIYMRSDVSKGAQSKDRISSKNVSRFISKGLASLPEGKVFEQGSGNWPSVDVNTRPSVGQADERERHVPVNLTLTKAALAGIFQQPTPPAVSMNHSDVQSLSSDALTDDSKSTVTDFSDMTAKSNEKRPGFQDFVPRTKRLTKASRQLPPAEFAKLLIEKLEKVALEREQEERAATNLAGLSHECVRGNKKSILEDAAERHQQFQKFGRLALLQPKFTEPCYPNPSRTVQNYVHPGYIEQQGIAGYYPSAVDGGHGSSWHEPECVTEKQHCAALGNSKKHWESVSNLESAPDSGVSIEEDFSCPPETRNRIHEWMEHNEKEAPHISHVNYKGRAKHSYNAGGVPGQLHGMMHLASVARDPLMPSLAQPDSQNTIEEAPRRLSPKESSEKRPKSHKNRTGYLSGKASHGNCSQFSGDGMSGDFHPAAMYSSSSVLSSVQSTVSSKDSGVGRAQKGTKPQEGTRIVYYVEGEKYPYQSIVPDKTVCLGQFKELIAFKKGHYRYFFKTETDEEDCGAIYEEIVENSAILPCYGNKIICKVRESKHV